MSSTLLSKFRRISRVHGRATAESPLAIFVRKDHPLVEQTLNQMIRQFPQVALYVADQKN